MRGHGCYRILTLLLALMLGFALRAEGQDWKTKWEKSVAGAKQEGKIAVAGPPGTAYRDVMRGFEKKYPGINLEFQGFTPAAFTSRFSKERQAGQYLWDVYITGPTSFDVTAKKAGELDPLRPVLILPEVLDESAWLGKFEKAFLDSEKQYIFAFQAEITPQVQVNREFIPESDLNSVKGLLNAKWKGKIVIDDPRVDGPGSGRIALWTGQLGEEFVRALLKQDLALTRDGRQLADWIARGKYPIAIGANDTEINELQKLGVGLKVEPLAGKLAEAWRIGTGWGAVRLVNRAPHPNAAAVFINWLLSKEGQTGWTTIGGRPSRRMDVARVTGLSPEPGVEYYDIDREERLNLRDRAKEIAKEVLR